MQRHLISIQDIRESEVKMSESLEENPKHVEIIEQSTEEDYFENL